MIPSGDGSSIEWIGQYRVIEKIGQGAMGSVYRAEAPGGAKVAIKVLANALNQNPVVKQRFLQEAHVAMRINHPNIVRALEVGEDAGRHFFVMELVDGDTVARLIKRQGRVSERDAIRIIVDVCRGLEEVHSMGLIHRDVKPANILLERDGTAKLVDLGLVKALDSDLGLTTPGKGLGTPQFMAPEQFKNARDADTRCDIYSMAATLYVMVTGEMPFHGATPMETFSKKAMNEYTPPSKFNPALSERTTRVIRLGMDADPKRRPATPARFAELLLGHADFSVDEVNVRWYLIAIDTDGKTRKIKGDQMAVVAEIQAGRVGPDARVATQRTGPFERIADVPEFREYFAADADSHWTHISLVVPKLTMFQRNVLLVIFALASFALGWTVVLISLEESVTK